MKWYPWLRPHFEQLIGSYQAGRGHHALLIQALPGMGDDALIYAITRFLMCQQPEGTRAVVNAVAASSCRRGRILTTTPLSLRRVKARSVSMPCVKSVKNCMNTRDWAALKWSGLKTPRCLPRRRLTPCLKPWKSRRLKRGFSSHVVTGTITGDVAQPLSSSSPCSTSGIVGAELA